MNKCYGVEVLEAAEAVIRVATGGVVGAVNEEVKVLPTARARATKGRNGAQGNKLHNASCVIVL